MWARRNADLVHHIAYRLGVIMYKFYFLNKNSPGFFFVQIMALKNPQETEIIFVVFQICLQTLQHESPGVGMRGHALQQGQGVTDPV